MNTVTLTTLRDSYREQTPDTRKTWAAEQFELIHATRSRLNAAVMRWLRRLVLGQYAPAPLVVVRAKDETFN